MICNNTTIGNHTILQNMRKRSHPNKTLSPIVILSLHEMVQFLLQKKFLPISKVPKSNTNDTPEDMVISKPS